MKTKVLIVDDEAPIRRLVARTLHRRGYECQAAEDAQAARRCLAEAEVDLLISDIRMPGESGIELVRCACREFPGMAILMLSGTDSDETIDTLMAIGIDGYVTKPFEKNQLIVSADLALRHRALTIQRQIHQQNLEHQVADRTEKMKHTIKDMVAARRETRKARSLFEALFKNANVGIAICKPMEDGRNFQFVDYNPTAEALDGKPRGHVLNRSLREVFPETERIGLLDLAQTVSRTGQSEERLITHTKKGQPRWRHYSLYRLPTGEVVAFYTDETERILAERRLRDQINFIRNLLESIPNPVFYKGTDGRFLGCNSAFSDLAGHTRESIVGLTTEDLAPPDLVQVYVAMDRELFVHEGERQIETQFQTAEGNRLDIILSKRSFTDNESRIAGVVGVLVDISERKRAEDNLKESESEFRAIAECAQDAIIKIDDNGRVTYWNRSAETIFGYTAAEVIGKALHPLIAPSRYHTRIRRTLDQFRRNGRGAGIGKVIDVTATSKDGREFPAELAISSVRLKGVWHAIGIVRDISARKQMEERLLFKHRKLKEIRDALEARNIHLSKMHAELKQAQQQTVQQEKMASIGQLAAGVAHEINNPTGFVSSNLKSLQDYLEDLFGLLTAYAKLRALLEASPGPDTAADVTEQLAEIKRIESDIDLDFLTTDTADLIRESREGTDRIKKIIIDLKDFAHPGQHERMTADINRNLESVLNIVWNELKYKATVQKDFGELPPVECYPQQLNQVFMNLLVNAGHAMETMGEIHITTRTAGDDVEIAIRDTGCGIPEANLQRIFDPFFTTKPVGKGTGLGLNVAYNIIKKHGGEIEVSSRVGEGTTFTIRLPLELPDDVSPEEEHYIDSAGERNVRQAS